MDTQNADDAILLVACVLPLCIIPLVGLLGKSRKLCNRKVIIFYLMKDELIDAEYCMYLRLIYRRDDAMWESLQIPVGEQVARARLHQLQKDFRDDEHSKVSGALHVLMANLKVEKKHDVFALPDEVVRKHYYDFIVGIKEEG